MPRKRICFVTGTRAEFGLMRSVLDAIRAHPKLSLQIVATGMHLDRSRGRTVAQIGKVDAIVAWPRGNSAGDRAAATGNAIAALARTFQRLKTDVVLVVGDRVEAFAAAAAGAIGGRIVAHVHGGDRALGQLDDSLRHAISKLAHIHFPATAESAGRLVRLGEDRRRIHCVGSPGIDGIVESAAKFTEVARMFPGLRPRRYALLALHPVDADARIEEKRAADLLAGTLAAGVDHVVLIDPNNDPGAMGIIRAWQRADGRRCMRRANVSRRVFLALLRDAACLIGNSSSGIIEAASFRTPVVDVGPRQQGRQRASDVKHIGHGRAAARNAAAQIWNGGRPRRGRGRNPYQTDGRAGRRIAEILGRAIITDKLLHKLIAY
jgi:GDP/UDP-N,N'-diacetylbacillosamine 2-epimerase (hydrolysing)